jgi:hypothetical protein
MNFSTISINSSSFFDFFNSLRRIFVNKISFLRIYSEDSESSLIISVKISIMNYKRCFYFKS